MMTNHSIKPRVANITHFDLQENKPKRHGRNPGFEHLKQEDMKAYAKELGCEALLHDYPFLLDKKLVFNPYLWKSFGRANYDTNTIEISEKIRTTEPAFQRNVFVRAASHFVAQKLYGDMRGESYESIVKRYLFPEETH